MRVHRLYGVFVAVAASAALGLLCGCVVGWRGQELARITPEVGIVVTYPIQSNVTFGGMVPLISPVSPSP